MHRLIATLGLVLASMVGSVRGDAYVVTLDPEVVGASGDGASGGGAGRLILFFITETSPRWSKTQPMEAPFFGKMQPVASVAVKELKPGESVTVDGSALAFPESLDNLNGPIRVQAVLDVDETERSHEQGPGNFYSDVVEATVSSTSEDHITLTLANVIKPRKVQQDTDTVKWIRMRSDLLSDFYGRDVYHLAGVALPSAYNDPDSKRTHWPTVYVIPGYGGRFDDRHEGAADYAQTLAHPGVPDIAPNAVYVVLDPESPLGHHGFVDSPSNGPRATALVKELIPHLEKEFRLVAKPEARIITGHSSGGWTSLWLALTYPQVFGACWSSAPDPVDFSAFQMTDLYHDQSMYVDAQGNDTPSFRRPANSDGDMATLMTVRQEARTEHALNPDGGSGQQWDAWEAMFSPRDSVTGMPKPMFDATTGAIDQEVVSEWAKHDIARLVTENWDQYGPIMTNNVRLACGEWDSFFLNRAVERLKTKTDGLRGEQSGDGYILLVPRATHETLPRSIGVRWNGEMRTYLIELGLQDDDEKPATKQE
jgi:hypothetical protein